MALIDRDKLLCAYCTDCNSGEKKPCPIPGRCHEYNLIKNAPALNRWIPCSERLPEKHVEVLAYSPYWGKIVVAMWGGEYWLEQWTDDDLEQSEITHWMPLPEPPEGGADDAT